MFGVRQLSRRTPRGRHVGRHSINSEAAMLGAEMERPSTQMDGVRARSFSGSSGVLLNQSARADSRLSGYDSVYGTGNNRTGGGSGRYTPTTPGAFSAAGQSPGGGVSPALGATGLRLAESADPYYRPPRRRATLDEGGGGVGTRQGSWPVENRVKRRSYTSADLEEDNHYMDGGTPTPAYLKAPREDPDELDAPSHPRTDYAVREVDFYYRVRGPALSSVSNRKLKTGPADPTGPVSSTTGWLRGIFKGKTKEKGKGFEVVRSTRAPPPGLMPPTERDSFAEPYRDEPRSPEDAAPAVGLAAQDQPRTEEPDADGQTGPIRSLSQSSRRPSLPVVSSSESIELPPRVGSQREGQGLSIRAPTIPRRSSKRNSAIDTRELRLENLQKLTSPTTTEEPESSETQTPIVNRHLNRFPFGSSKSTSIRSAPVSSCSASSAHNDDDNNSNSNASTARGNRPNGRTSVRAGETENQRPSSVGYVRQHRASDHIHEAGPDILPLSESAAEIVKEP